MEGVTTLTHSPSTGTHPHPSSVSLSTTVSGETSFASISGARSSRRASSTSSASTPAMVTPCFAATYALYSCPPRITASARFAIARIVPIFVSSLDPAITATNGRVG